jgi:hypothetical protein
LTPGKEVEALVEILTFAFVPDVVGACVQGNKLRAVVAFLQGDTFEELMAVEEANEEVVDGDDGVDYKGALLALLLHPFHPYEGEGAFEDEGLEAAGDEGLVEEVLLLLFCSFRMLKRNQDIH